jgi:hypothetical protein
VSKHAGAPRRKPARRPEPRTVDIKLDGELGGWEFTAKVDFPAKWLTDLGTDLGAVVAVLDRIVIDHNFPGEDGELAESMGDVDATSLGQVTAALQRAMGTLPNR